MTIRFPRRSLARSLGFLSLLLIAGAAANSIQRRLSQSACTAEPNHFNSRDGAGIRHFPE